MYCSKCGTNVTDGAAFCSACGQPTAGPATITPARPAPGIPPPPYASPALAPILASPYAGFWLRVVAHLIDDLLLGIGIGILVLIGVAMVGVGSARLALQRRNGKFPASRNFGKNGAGVDRYGFARPPNRFRPRHRALLRKNYHWPDSVGNWLRDGGIR